jgi:hypothetical protein
MRSSRVLLADDHPSLAAVIGVEVVRHALAGASGFALKAYAPTELVHAIRTVLDGGTYVSSAIAM